MSRRLDDLSEGFRPLAFELLARLIEENIPIMIIDTLRSPAEQAANLAAGKSWTAKSKHLTGDAIDICPWGQYELHGPDRLQWDADDPIWIRIGVIGERIGLRWGGRWKQRDMGHFERTEPAAVPRPALPHIRAADRG